MVHSNIANKSEVNVNVNKHRHGHKTVAKVLVKLVSKSCMCSEASIKIAYIVNQNSGVTTETMCFIIHDLDLVEKEAFICHIQYIR